MGKLAILIFLSAFFSSGYPQEKKKPQLFVLGKSIKMKFGSNKLPIKIQLSNFSDSTFLLYGINEIEGDIPNIEWYKQSDLTCGVALFIFDDRGTFLNAGVKEEEISWDSIVKRYSRKVILKSKQIYTSELFARLGSKHHRLKRGIYSLSLIYYGGSNVYNVVPEEAIQNDTKLFSANLFQGYLVSNKVRLIIE